jgi:hypothetical protein
VLINESDIGKVRVGEKVWFTVSAYQDDNKVFSGEVLETRLLPTTQQGAVYYTALITAKNDKDDHDNWLLRPGMTTAGVDIVAKTEKDVWLVPNTALDFQLDEGYITPSAKEELANNSPGAGWVAIWTVEGNTPKPLWVKPGLTGKVRDAQNGGLKSEQYTVVEWDPRLTPQPKPDVPDSYPKLIIGAPPVKKWQIFGGKLSTVTRF